MTQVPVPLIVLSGRQDDVELVNRALRDGGHAVRCHWVTKLESLAETIDAWKADWLAMLKAPRVELATAHILGR